MRVTGISHMGNKKAADFVVCLIYQTLFSKRGIESWGITPAIHNEAKIVVYLRSLQKLTLDFIECWLTEHFFLRNIHCFLSWCVEHDSRIEAAIAT